MLTNYSFTKNMKVFSLFIFSFLPSIFCQWQNPKNTYKMPYWKGMKLAEWAQNQKYDGIGAQLQVPKPLEQNEPELKFYGYVDPISQAPLTVGPNGNQVATVCRDFRFDIRDKWPECDGIISHIRDQSLCSSCYAQSVAAAFSDRYCIELAKLGMLNDPSLATHFSAADIMDCSKAGSDDACNGGYSSRVWRWLTEVGLSTDSCKPYPISSYEKVPINGATKFNEFNYPAICKKYCTNESHSSNYYDDKKIAQNYNVIGTLEGPIKTWYYYKPQNQRSFSWEQTMKEELLNNGSITVDYLVHDDFFDYPLNPGIYRHTYGSAQYAHVVRLIGYGRVECNDGRNAEKYWLAANTWGQNWAQNGLFRIARGNDECGIESRQIGYGTPKVSL